MVSRWPPRGDRMGTKRGKVLRVCLKETCRAFVAGVGLRSDGYAGFRTKGRSIIARGALGSMHLNAGSIQMRPTRRRFVGSCVEQPEEAAGHLAPSEALRMLKQQFQHGVHSGYTQHELYLMSPQAPYVPMGPRDPLAGDAEVTGMFKKLAARSGKNVGVSKAGQSPQAKTDASYDLKRLDHEAWLAKRLGQHGQNVFTGDTDRNMRKERFRKAIKDAGFECVIVGKARNGEPETYESCFARLYGEPL